MFTSFPTSWSVHYTLGFTDTALQVFLSEATCMVSQVFLWNMNESNFFSACLKNQHHMDNTKICLQAPSKLGIRSLWEPEWLSTVKWISESQFPSCSFGGRDPRFLFSKQRFIPCNTWLVWSGWFLRCLLLNSIFPSLRMMSVLNRQQCMGSRKIESIKE